MGVHFKSIPRFSVAERVLFWHTLRGDFPLVEDRPAIDEEVESFDDANPTTARVKWEVFDAPPTRLWAKSADGHHTLQLQRNALLVNWERDARNPSVPYTPYEQRRADLAAKLTLLESFVGEHKLGALRPTNCFATYINQIPYRPGETHDALCSRLLATWGRQRSDSWLPDAEDATIKLAYRMPENAGRLHITLVPALRLSDESRIVRLDLTARGPVKQASCAGALEMMDVAHDWIVRGFASITTPEMHAEWERRS